MIPISDGSASQNIASEWQLSIWDRYGITESEYSLDKAVEFC